MSIKNHGQWQLNLHWLLLIRLNRIFHNINLQYVCGRSYKSTSTQLFPSTNFLFIPNRPLHWPGTRWLPRTLHTLHIYFINRFSIDCYALFFLCVVADNVNTFWIWASVLESVSLIITTAITFIMLILYPFINRFVYSRKTMNFAEFIAMKHCIWIRPFYWWNELSSCCR